MDGPTDLSRSDAAASQPRRRNARATRADLLAAASRRFARHGYAHTTLRDIAKDVGVSVGLVGRYFDSKPQLFEECLTQALAATQATALEGSTPSSVAEIIAQQVTDTSWEPRGTEVLLLLLRSSGDPRTENARTRALQEMTDSLHSLIAPDVHDGRLRAQLVQATAMGMILLHTARNLDPLAHATYDELLPPLRDIILATLEPRPANEDSSGPR